MKSNLLFSIILLSGLLLLAGCYTVLVHPEIEVKDENGYVYNNNVHYYDDCSSCHTYVDSRNAGSSAMRKADSSRANFEYYDYDENYYTDSYYGDYGYYYNYPWWLEVTPPVKYRERTRENYTGSARDNNSERSSDSREGRYELSLPSPTVSSGSSSSTSSSSTSNNTTKSETNSNDNRNDRNSSGTSGSRDNSGGRSTDSGRRR